MNLTKEQKGEIFIFFECILYGLFPILINYSTKLMEPILFAGVSVFMASIGLFIHLLIKKQLHHIFNKKAFLYILAVTLFIIILPDIFIFTGTSKTSGINTAILLQSELLFALIICGIFFKEKITKNKIIGSIIVILGATIILYNGSFEINRGEMLILAGTIFYPIGNFYAKKALKLVPSTVVIFIRSFLGGISLILISFIFENSASSLIPSTQKYILYLAANGIIIMYISKILWYEGLKRLDISKATALAMCSPGIGLIFAILLLKETPSLYQLSGLIILSIGAFFIIRKTASTHLKTPPI